MDRPRRAAAGDVRRALRRRTDAIIAGAINPSGSIEAVDGGYRVNGRWAFASGCQHASWIFGDCIEGVVDGVPQLRIAVFSPDQVVIEDTWYVSGLAGTGSHHFHVDGVVVPADWTYSVLAGEPCIDETIVRIPPPALIACVVASVAIGTAQGALDEIVELAAHKVPLLDRAPLAANPTFQLDLATADTELRAAASAGRTTTAASLWAMAVEGDEPTLRGPGARPGGGGVGDRRGRRRRRHGVPRRRRQLAVPRQPAAAPAPRHPRPHPALHRPAATR